MTSLIQHVASTNFVVEERRDYTLILHLPAATIDQLAESKRYAFYN